MLDPIVYCTTCKRQRNVMLHVRAEDPPAAARKWMARLCLRKGYSTSMQKACDVRYRAGFAIGGPAVGQVMPMFCSCPPGECRAEHGPQHRCKFQSRV